VPSVLYELDRLLPLADFVSIGSNDLVQFLTAADRSNPRVSRSYDPIGLPRLRALRHIARAAAIHEVPLTMCGELAGRPVEALALMAVGITRLSMAASSIGPIKELVRAMELGPIQAEVETALDASDDFTPMRERLIHAAERQDLPL
jgi:phosphotransferase system enzyme I (PtsP)